LVSLYEIIPTKRKAQLARSDGESIQANQIRKIEIIFAYK